ncbi:MAG: hypothetical protein AB2A00_42050 [Myxococcota bacterium]
MRNRFLVGLLLCVALLPPSRVLGAEQKAKEEDAAAQAEPARFSEIERGLWFSLEAAPIVHLDWRTTLPPDDLPRQLLPDDVGGGIRAGGRVGYDILGLVSLDGYWVAQFKDKRIRRGRSATGDLSDLNAGLSLRLMPVTLFQRLSFTGRLSLGGAFLLPGEVARANANSGCVVTFASSDVTTGSINAAPVPPEPTTINPLCVALPKVKTWDNPLGIQPLPGTVIAFSPTAEAMVGVEYFTKLRHFSIGADLVVGTVLWPLTVHAGVVPHVKYTF